MLLTGLPIEKQSLNIVVMLITRRVGFHAGFGEDRVG